MAVGTRPYVVSLIGLPGAGKTTLVEWLDRRLDVRVVSRDSVRDAMFRPCAFTAVEKAAAFNALKTALRVNLQLGTSTILDGMCFSTADDRHAIQHLVHDCSAINIPIYCDCPVSVAEARVERDRLYGSHPALDRDAHLVRSVARSFQDVPQCIPRIDMTQSVERIGKSALQVICELAEVIYIGTGAQC